MTHKRTMLDDKSLPTRLAVPSIAVLNF